MFSGRELYQYFPSCVWTHDLADFKDMNTRLVQELQALRARDTGSLSERGAWQSDCNLHALEPFQPLTRSFVAASQGVLEFLKYSYTHFEITDCWANVNRRGESHSLHSHPNNFLSGVYYVRAPENCGNIVFSDPRPQASVLIPHVTERNPYNSFKHSIKPKEGRLLMFHSWFQHLVEANQSEEERISISFNVLLRGRIGYSSGGAEL